MRDLDAGVLRRMHCRLGVRVYVALLSQSPALARDACWDAESMPSTESQVRLGGLRLQLNVPLPEGNAHLIVCFRDAVPHVLKVHEKEEASKIQRAIGQLDLHEALHIIRFEWVEQRHMLVPYFASTLEHIPSGLSASVTSRLWEQMSAALCYLHVRGVAHMDVKPSNIFVDSVGAFSLGDLGSVARFGERTSSTPAFLPRDMQSERIVSAAGIDWWMLAMTMADKVAGREMGSSRQREPTRDEVKSILQGCNVMTQSFVWEKLLPEEEVKVEGSASKYLSPSAALFTPSDLH